MTAADRHSGPHRSVAGAPSAESGQPSLLEQLRAVNEQLVVSSMRAQASADDADVSRTAAEAANRMKDEFLATVSHELRTPLSAIVGWAGLLSSGQLDAPRTTHAIATIERNAKALARIIDDLLDVSRIIGGTVRIDALPVDLVAVIQGAMDEVRLTSKARNVHLTFTCSTPPPPVTGDALRLQQVVTNLLANAIKFTPPEGRVEVTLAGHGSEAEIRVADTGQGIEAGFLPHIFARFSQADASTTRRQGGIGLGLAIVRALVERHGGTVRAESAGPGRGATFTVRLPVMSAAAGPGPVPDSGTTLTPVSRLDGIRALLVEDDEDGRVVVAAILEVAGAAVVPVGSAREALAVLDTEPCDVIVSDIGMPDEDGYALLQQVRARGEHRGGLIPAIALTGFVRNEDRSRMLAAGFQAHVRKPVDRDELVAAIAAHATKRGP